ncbi:MAG: glycosyltransferase [Archangiaceae bacterium]|nr:glycosyltransferase [Archangiaceae bacterium]
MRSILVVSPESYPSELAKEHTFLGPELPVLADAFDRVVVVPQQLEGARASLPRGVALDETLAHEVRGLTSLQLALHAARTSLVAEDIARRRQLVANPVAMKRLIAFAGRAHHARQWAERWLRGVDPRTRVVFYTYWWGPTTTGFGLAKRKNVKVATRAHGFDLYEERHTPAYLPCRVRSLSVLDALFPDSDKGREYLEAAHGHRLPDCETFRLGTAAPGAVTAPSTDGALRVVSCSMQVPVKRLPLLMSGLAAAGRREPTRRIEWTHFGTGALQPELEAQAVREFPGNVSVRFGGYSTQPDLYRWYASNPVDVFVNVSQSEGTPVSVMEAVSFGIPVLATAVGGNPEIATSRNAVLLSPNPTAEEVATGLLRFTESSTQSTLRPGSVEVWREKYDGARNLGAFVHRLQTLLR